MTPLRSEDIDTLARLGRPRWKRWLLGGAATLAALLAIVAHTIVDESLGCTGVCDTQLSTVSAGLVIGVMVVVALSPYAGAALAAASVIVVAVDDLMNPALDWPAWLYVVDLGLVALCVAGVRLPRATGAAAEWMSATVHSRPPTPQPAGARSLNSRDPWRVLAWLLLAVAVLGGTWAWSLQTTMDERQRAVRQVDAQVYEQADDTTVRVRLPDGATARVSVEAASDYPINGTIRLYVDDRGLRQPVREPYDLSGWLLLPVAAGAIGVGVLARRWAAARAKQSLFDQDQPVCQVLVHQWWGDVNIYLAGSATEEPTGLTYRYPDWDPPGADSDLLAVVRHGAVPAQLYGVPAAGRWCVAVVNGVALTPAGPLRRVTPDPVPLIDEDDADDESTVDELDDDFLFARLEPEEIARVDPADRDADPSEVRLHVQHPALAYVTSGLSRSRSALSKSRSAVSVGSAGSSGAYPAPVAPLRRSPSPLSTPASGTTTAATR